MKLIKRDSNKRPSALERARKRLAARKEEAKAAPPPGEIFVQNFVCSKTGRDFLVVWHRAAPHLRFRVHETSKYAAQGGGEAQANKEEVRSHPASAFATSELTCPWCGHTDFIYCSCGTDACGGAIYFKDGVQRFRLESCGCDGPIKSGVERFSGRTPDGASNKTLGKQEPARRISKDAKLLR